jgi:hypothetical protein
MLDQVESLSDPFPPWATEARPLRRISAVLLCKAADGSFRIGAGTQLEPDAVLAVCGPGFDDLTVRVRVSGQFYLVFQQDIMVFKEEIEVSALGS